MAEPKKTQARSAADTLLRLGITGPIGSGKSAVCAILREMGGEIFSADAAAKQVLRDDPVVRAAVIGRFGSGAYGADGNPVAKHLSARVFADVVNVKFLNGLVHPRVYREWEKFVAEVREKTSSGARKDLAPLAVLEAALLLESGGAEQVDRVWVVDAPEEVRLARLEASGRITRAEALHRAAFQLAAAEMRQRADRVIENAGTPAALAEVVRRSTGIDVGTFGRQNSPPAP